MGSNLIGLSRPLKTKKDILLPSTLSELTESKSNRGLFHSLTTDSFGLLVDVRTGGLKRDLSNAFANEPDWEELISA